eukprot:m.19178 g.19178  ORF g.19178 m.19178 type:complete len:77 (-) comp5076_c0_seq1:946-1176(-)
MFGRQLVEINNKIKEAQGGDREVDLRYNMVPKLVIGHICSKLKESTNVNKLWLHGCHLDDGGVIITKLRGLHLYKN